MRRSPSHHYRRYLPISDADRAWGLHVVCGGYLHIAPGTSYPPPGHPERYNLIWRDGRVLDEHQLHFITRGGGDFESDGVRQRRIEPGSVFLLFPGVWHRYQPDPEQGWDEWWIGFDGEQARRIMRPPFFSSAQPVIAVGERSALLEHFTALVTVLREDRPQMQRILAGLAGMLLGTLQVSAAGVDDDARGTRVVQDAKRRLTAAVTRPVDGEVLARELGVGYHWLRRAFRHQTGMTLHQFHSQLRMHAAMQLLESSEREIGDIARELGFADPYYFSRVFRNEVGAAPQRWRAQRRRRA